MAVTVPLDVVHTLAVPSVESYWTALYGCHSTARCGAHTCCTFCRVLLGRTAWTSDTGFSRRYKITDWQTDGRWDRLVDKLTDGETDRQKDIRRKRADRQTHRQRKVQDRRTDGQVELVSNTAYNLPNKERLI